MSGSFPDLDLPEWRSPNGSRGWLRCQLLGERSSVSMWMGESKMMTAYVAVEGVDLSVVQARPPIGHLSLLVFRLGPGIEPWLPT